MKKESPLRAFDPNYARKHGIDLATTATSLVTTIFDNPIDETTMEF